MTEDNSSALSPRLADTRATGRRRVLQAVAWSAAGLTLLGGAGLGYVYFRLNGNLKGVDIDTALGADRPRNVDNGSMDILVLGSDSRGGANGTYGTDDGTARADTAMILHVYKGHKKATVVSIPRDTMVSRPKCEQRAGKTAPAAKQVMFNASYQVGGPACTVKTVEKMSGIRMDHYIEVDFNGFKTLVDELGGVPVTTAKPIHDKQSRLDLKPGEHTLNGEQALGLVRTRHAVGDGSDLGRIQLQQAFLKALIGKAKDVNLFDSPRKLYNLADTATQNVTTDSRLASVTELLRFTKGLKRIDAGDMRMVTLPVSYDKAQPDRVVPLDRQCRQVWDALRQDKPVPASATKGTAGDAVHASDVIKSS